MAQTFTLELNPPLRDAVACALEGDGVAFVLESGAIVIPIDHLEEAASAVTDKCSALARVDNGHLCFAMHGLVNLLWEQCARQERSA